MKIENLIQSVMIILVVAVSSAYCGLFEYFDAISEDVPARLKLSIEQSVTHESNVFDAPDDRTSGYRFKTTLGMNRVKSIGKIDYRVTGHVGYEYVPNQSSLTTPTYSINPSIVYKHGSWNLMLDAKSSYKKDHVSNVDRRTSRQQKNSFEIVWDWRSSSKFGVALTGKWYNINHTGSHFKGLDYTSYEFSVAPYYVISEKTKVGLRGGYVAKRYESHIRNDDSDRIFADLFTDYRISGKITLHAFAGIFKEDFDKKASNGHNAEDGKYNFHYGLDVNYKMLNNLAFTAGFIRDMENNTVNETRSVDMTTWMFLDTKWNISKKLALTTYSSYEWEDQRDNNLDNQVLRLGINLAYTFPGEALVVFGGYEYESTQFSHNSSLDYSNNTFTLGARYTF